MKTLFEEEQKEVLRQFRGGQKPHLEVSRWVDLILATDTAVAQNFGQELGGMMRKKSASDPWMDRVLSYIRNNALKKAKMITETSISDIQGILEDGFASGLGTEEIAGQIEKYYEDIADWRALLIARTETHAAANLGTNSFAQEAGMQYHVWMAAMDELTRPWHASANGLRVPLDEPFVIEGEELMFPGDDSLGASGINLCNCRCVEVYE